VATVLVVDDSLTIRKLIELSLRPHGHTVEFAASLEDALKKIRNNKPHAMFLDYVLPDGRGVDLCWQLQDLKISIPTIVVSGKRDAIREQFANFPDVRDFLGKPFTQQEVGRMVGSLLAEQGPGPPSTQEAERQVAAKIDVPDASAFPADATVPRGISTLIRHASQGLNLGMLQPLQNAQASFAELGSEDVFVMQCKAEVALGSLASMATIVRDGEIRFNSGSDVVSVYVHRGHSALATTTTSESYLDACPAETSLFDPALLQSALREQDDSGAPYLIRFAEDGLFNKSELVRTLVQTGQALLRKLLERLGERTLTVRGIKRASIPTYVLSYGTRLSVAQLHLELLRTQKRASESLSDETVVERATGYGTRVKDLALNEAERRALLLVDGKRTVAELTSDRTLAEETRAALERLCRLGIININAAQVKSEPVVLVLDADIEGVMAPLKGMLMGRPTPVGLVDLRQHEDWLQPVKDRSPQLLLLNIDEDSEKCIKFAKELKFGAESVDFPLVAMLAYPNSERSIALRTAGFDAVLEKPFHMDALERFLI
jgi:DNA-binding response OmpR family regulator